jgi:hypothetical protein
MQGGHLPPVGQLAGHHVGLFHAKAGKAGGHAGDDAVEFAVAQGGAGVLADVVGDQGLAIRRGSHRRVQIVCNDLVVPGADFKHGGPTRGRDVRLDLHVQHRSMLSFFCWTGQGRPIRRR